MTEAIWRRPKVRGYSRFWASYVLSSHIQTQTHIYCLSTFKHRRADGEKANPSGKICYTDVMCGGLLFWIQLFLLFPVASSSLLILYLSMTFSPI